MQCMQGACAVETAAAKGRSCVGQEASPSSVTLRLPEEADAIAAATAAAAAAACSSHTWYAGFCCSS